jgi:hypothetical protein
MRLAVLGASLTARASASGQRSGGSDVTPPTISLDFEGATVVPYAESTYGQHACQTHVAHPVCADRHRRSNQSYSKTCQVQIDTLITCTEPAPSAYDHHDGDVTQQIAIRRRLFISSNPGHLPVRVDEPVLAIPTTAVGGTLSQRGEYVLTYTVSDFSGNAAEELAFAMVIADEVPPVFDQTIFDTFKHKYAELWSMDATQHTEDREAAQYAATPSADFRRRQFLALPRTLTAVDSYDGAVEVSSILTDPDGATVALAQIDTRVLGVWTAQYFAHDAADVFGLGGANNTALSATVTFEVKDTEPPLLYCKPQTLDFDTIQWDSVTLVGQPFASVTGVADLTVCASLCFESQWQSVNGVVCRGFAFNAGTCHMHSQTFHPHPGAVNQGYILRQCGEGHDLVEYACNPSHYEDPGAICVDTRDSFNDVDGGVIPDALTYQSEIYHLQPDPTDYCADCTMRVPNAGPIDRQAPGTYEIVYNCKDTAQLSAGSLTRVVIVAEVPAPHISVGAADASVLQSHPGQSLALNISEFTCSTKCGPCNIPASSIAASNVSYFIPQPPAPTGHIFDPARFPGRAAIALTDHIPAGSHTIPVTDVAGFRIGDIIKLNPGTATSEFKMVTKLWPGHHAVTDLDDSFGRRLLPGAGHSLYSGMAVEGMMKFNEGVHHDHYPGEPINWVASNTTCEPCDPGQFSLGHMTACAWCPSGKFSAMAASECTHYETDSCPLGEWFNHDTDVCDLCAHASYSVWISHKNCAENHCPQHSYQSPDSYHSCVSDPPALNGTTITGHALGAASSSSHTSLNNSSETDCGNGFRSCKQFDGGTTCFRPEISLIPPGECCPGECVEIGGNDRSINDNNQSSVPGEIQRQVQAGTIYLHYVIGIQTAIGASADVLCKKVELVHQGQPVISMKGSDWSSVASTPESPFPTNYQTWVDPGATCFDIEDGDLTHNLMATRTTTALLCMPYIAVDYRCFDSEGKSAYTAFRKVYFQPPRPICTVNEGPATVEASFPYKDPGASCAVGVMPVAAQIWSDTGDEYTQHNSAHSIVNAERTGTYVVTYRARNGCGQYNSDAARAKRTVVVVDTLMPVLALSDRVSGVRFHGSAPVTSAVTGPEIDSVLLTPENSFGGLSPDYTPGEALAAGPLAGLIPPRPLAGLIPGGGRRRLEAAAWSNGAAAPGRSALALLSYAGIGMVALVQLTTRHRRRRNPRGRSEVIEL